MTMQLSRSIPADHRDLIHDLAYDFYGRRMATCSSDQYVKVWDLGDDNQWKCTSSWKAHSGSVWKITWAYPEFGQVLATCSFDRTAAVWEELGSEGAGGERTLSQWVKKTSLVDSRTPVTDVKFAPKHLGLQLATCSADGGVRIYEAPDVMNLSQWCLQHEISTKLSCSCISWSQSRTQLPMIAVGSDDPSQSAGSKVSIFIHSENCRRWLRVEGVEVKEPIYDISFAPTNGGSHHHLAIASKSVQIIQLKPILDKSSAMHESIPKYEIRVIAHFDRRNSQVWRISWNVTGTVLASSGEDGCVKLWKPNFLNKWDCFQVIKGKKDKDGSASDNTYYDLPSSHLNRLGPVHLRPWH